MLEFSVLVTAVDCDCATLELVTGVSEVPAPLLVRRDEVVGRGAEL